MASEEQFNEWLKLADELYDTEDSADRAAQLLSEMADVSEADPDKLIPIVRERAKEIGGIDTLSRFIQSDLLENDIEDPNEFMREKGLLLAIPTLPPDVSKEATEAWKGEAIASLEDQVKENPELEPYFMQLEAHLDDIGSFYSLSKGDSPEAKKFQFDKEAAEFEDEGLLERAVKAPFRIAGGAITGAIDSVLNPVEGLLEEGAKTISQKYLYGNTFLEESVDTFFDAKRRQMLPMRPNAGSTAGEIASIGGQVAGTIVAAGVAATAGAPVAITTAGVMGLGSAIQQRRENVDESGGTIDQEREASTGIGVLIEGGIESISSLFGASAIGKNIAKKLGSLAGAYRYLPQSVKNQIFKEPVKKTSRYLATMGVEGSTEVFQGALSDEAVGDAIDDNTTFRWDNVERRLDDLKGGVIGGAVGHAIVNRITPQTKDPAQSKLNETDVEAEELLAEYDRQVEESTIASAAPAVEQTTPVFPENNKATVTNITEDEAIPDQLVKHFSKNPTTPEQAAITTAEAPQTAAPVAQGIAPEEIQKALLEHAIARNTAREALQRSGERKARSGAEQFTAQPEYQQLLQTKDPAEARALVDAIVANATQKLEQAQTSGNLPRNVYREVLSLADDWRDSTDPNRPVSEDGVPAWIKATESLGQIIQSSRARSVSGFKPSTIEKRANAINAGKVRAENLGKRKTKFEQLRDQVATAKKKGTAFPDGFLDAVESIVSDDPVKQDEISAISKENVPYKATLRRAVNRVRNLAPILNRVARIANESKSAIDIDEFNKIVRPFGYEITKQNGEFSADAVSSPSDDLDNEPSLEGLTPEQRSIFDEEVNRAGIKTGSFGAMLSAMGDGSIESRGFSVKDGPKYGEGSRDPNATLGRNLRKLARGEYVNIKQLSALDDFLKDTLDTLLIPDIGENMGETPIKAEMKSKQKLKDEKLLRSAEEQLKKEQRRRAIQETEAPIRAKTMGKVGKKLKLKRARPFAGSMNVSDVSPDVTTDRIRAVARAVAADPATKYSVGGVVSTRAARSDLKSKGTEIEPGVASRGYTTQDRATGETVSRLTNQNVARYETGAAQRIDMHEFVAEPIMLHDFSTKEGQEKITNLRRGKTDEIIKIVNRHVHEPVSRADVVLTKHKKGKYVDEIGPAVISEYFLDPAGFERQFPMVFKGFIKPHILSDKAGALTKRMLSEFARLPSTKAVLDENIARIKEDTDAQIKIEQERGRRTFADYRNSFAKTFRKAYEWAFNSTAETFRISDGIMDRKSAAALKLMVNRHMARNSTAEAHVASMIAGAGEIMNGSTLAPEVVNTYLALRDITNSQKAADVDLASGQAAGHSRGTNIQISDVSEALNNVINEFSATSPNVTDQQLSAIRETLEKFADAIAYNGYHSGLADELYTHLEPLLGVEGGLEKVDAALTRVSRFGRKNYKGTRYLRQFFSPSSWDRGSRPSGFGTKEASRRQLAELMNSLSPDDTKRLQDLSAFSAENLKAALTNAFNQGMLERPLYREMMINADSYSPRIVLDTIENSQGVPLTAVASEGAINLSTNSLGAIITRIAHLNDQTNTNRMINQIVNVYSKYDTIHAADGKLLEVMGKEGQFVTGEDDQLTRLKRKDIEDRYNKLVANRAPDSEYSYVKQYITERDPQTNEIKRSGKIQLVRIKDNQVIQNNILQKMKEATPLEEMIAKFATTNRIFAALSLPVQVAEVRRGAKAIAQLQKGGDRVENYALGSLQAIRDYPGALYDSYTGIAGDFWNDTRKQAWSQSLRTDAQKMLEAYRNPIDLEVQADTLTDEQLKFQVLAQGWIPTLANTVGGTQSGIDALRSLNASQLDLFFGHMGAAFAGQTPQVPKGVFGNMAHGLGRSVDLALATGQAIEQSQKMTAVRTIIASNPGISLGEAFLQADELVGNPAIRTRGSFTRQFGPALSLTTMFLGPTLAGLRQIGVLGKAIKDGNRHITQNLIAAQTIGATTMLASGMAASLIAEIISGTDDDDPIFIKEMEEYEKRIPSIDYANNDIIHTYSFRNRRTGEVAFVGEGKVTPNDPNWEARYLKSPKSYHERAMFGAAIAGIANVSKTGSVSEGVSAVASYLTRMTDIAPQPFARGIAQTFAAAAFSSNPTDSQGRQIGTPDQLAAGRMEKTKLAFNQFLLDGLGPLGLERNTGATGEAAGDLSPASSIYFLPDNTALVLNDKLQYKPLKPLSNWFSKSSSGGIYEVDDMVEQELAQKNLAYDRMMPSNIAKMDKRLKELDQVRRMNRDKFREQYDNPLTRAKLPEAWLFGGNRKAAYEFVTLKAIESMVRPELEFGKEVFYEHGATPALESGLKKIDGVVGKLQKHFDKKN